MIGIPEIIVIVLGLLICSIIAYLYWAVADYGRNTSLGFYGSFFLALFTSPIIAYFILLLFFERNDSEDY
ncbi:hypothetical protein ACFOG5_09505 [Pedobacter fastidiosus]|uniref:Uncharacterized protein n=1 Tax=Pedobacter fastidiosus TaxID=2765361 RepID=A0ABR7KT35_9SPHI|nr:hypothetical protein [Pedobacter fastidiosus]MBC6111216.1 hypothetical protein [Pedobacter fastidiosus]